AGGGGGCWGVCVWGWWWGRGGGGGGSGRGGRAGFPPASMLRKRGTRAMSEHTREVATLGGGCFWCIDAVFRELRGVERIESGYAGGDYLNPSYRDVCSGLTG